MKTIIPLAAVILLAPLATAVTAQRTKDSLATEMVSYADLHLDSMRDRERLEWRVRGAASRLCTEDTRAVPTAYINSGCFRAAMVNAHRQMDRAIALANGGRVIAASALVISGK